MPLTSPSKLNIVSYTIFFILPILFVLHSNLGFAQNDLPVSSAADDALEEELRYLKAETYVITASRIPEDIKKTASSISVITDRQIRQMGARHLADVLQVVPGMSTWYHPEGQHAIAVRGITKSSSNIVLLMLNGHPLNESWSGGATWIHDTMMLDNVKRIEVIRGPGSALYGANAFAGVINVITKEAEDIDGWELTVRGGSYDTQQYNLLYGKTHKDLEITFNYNYFNTHGFNGHLDKDALSISPSILNRKASLVPSRLKGDDEKYDVALNLKYKGFIFDGRYVDREMDDPVSGLGILNNKNTWSPKNYYLNIGYEKTLWEDLTIYGKVYRNHDRNRYFYQTPSGTTLLTPVGPVIMKDGKTSSESLKNNRTGFEIQTTYNIFDTNTIVAGITYEEMKQYDVNRRTNFLWTSIPFVEIPLPSVRDLSHIQNHNRSAKRNFKAFFFEDIWDVTDNLRLTVGVRYDDYSDFGNEVSPRAGLVWEFIEGYDVKLLYGHAFRAPNFQELYSFSGGNPDLDPETIDTYEVSLGAEFTSSLSSRVTFYHSQGDDNIVPLLFGYMNYGKVRLQGVEVEAKYDFGRGSYLAMNYTYRRIMSPHTIGRADWPTPKHLGNIMANVRLSKHLNLYTSCHIEDGFRRDRGDSRDNMSGYAIVNATLIAKKFLKGYQGLEIRGSVYNLFDKDYTSPYYPSLLPDDMPRPGRNFMIEMKYKF